MKKNLLTCKSQHTQSRVTNIQKPRKFSMPKNSFPFVSYQTTQTISKFLYDFGLVFLAEPKSRLSLYELWASTVKIVAIFQTIGIKSIWSGFRLSILIIRFVFKRNDINDDLFFDLRKSMLCLSTFTFKCSMFNSADITCFALCDLLVDRPIAKAMLIFSE